MRFSLQSGMEMTLIQAGANSTRRTAMAVKRWKCICGYLNTDQEVEDSLVCIDRGDRYQPEEWASYCVSCGRDHEHQEETWICSDTCENEAEDGYDSCLECLDDEDHPIDPGGRADWAEYQLGGDR